MAQAETTGPQWMRQQVPSNIQAISFRQRAEIFLLVFNEHPVSPFQVSGDCVIGCIKCVQIGVTIRRTD